MKLQLPAKKMQLKESCKYNVAMICYEKNVSLKVRLHNKNALKMEKKIPWRF